MGELRISRRQMLGARCRTLGVVLAPETVLADDGEMALLRWGLVQVGTGPRWVPGCRGVMR